MILHNFQKINLLVILFKILLKKDAERDYLINKLYLPIKLDKIKKNEKKNNPKHILMQHFL